MNYRIRASESPCEVVIRAVADVTDRDPLDLDPIADTVDPEAIDTMFTRSSREDVATLKLIYEGCRVEVTSDVVHVEKIPHR